MILLIGTISIIIIIGTTISFFKLIDYINDKYNKNIDDNILWIIFVVEILAALQVLYNLNLIR